MPMPKGKCSKCHEDFMNCQCDSFHPNLDEFIKFDTWLNCIEKIADFIKIRFPNLNVSETQRIAHSLVTLVRAELEKN